MKLMHKICLVLLILFNTSLFSINKNAGTSGFSFLKLNVSARAAALGNAYSALVDDANAVFFNPAGLLNFDKKQVSTSYMSYIDGSQLGAITYASVEEQFRWAGFIQYFNSGEITRTLASPDGSYLGTDGEFSTSNVLFGLSTAHHFNERFELGVSVKYLIETLDEENASAIVADIGILHQSTNPKLKLAIGVRNLGKQLSYFTEEEYEEELPVTFIAGAKFQQSESFLITGDAYLPRNEDLAIRVGLEKIVNPYFTGRLGYDSRGANWGISDDFGSKISGISAGFGTKWKLMKIDYAIVSYGDLGYQNQISLGYKFL